MDLNEAFDKTIHLMNTENIDDYIDLMSWLFDVDEEIIITKIKENKNLYN